MMLDLCPSPAVLRDLPNDRLVVLVLALERLVSEGGDGELRERYAVAFGELRRRKGHVSDESKGEQIVRSLPVPADEILIVYEAPTHTIYKLKSHRKILVPKG